MKLIKSNLLIRSFLATLICVCAATGAITWPTGTQAVIPITVSKAYVSDAATNYLYQFILILTNETNFKAAFSSAANITVFDTTTGLQRASWIKYNNKDTIYIYFDGPSSTSANKTFFVCAGADINRTNSASAFTNSGISNFWGTDEFVNGGTTANYTGGTTGTVSTPAALGSAGNFGPCASYENNASSKVTIAGQTIGNGDVTIEFMFNLISSPNGGIGRVMDNGNFFIMVSPTRLNVTSNGGTTLAYADCITTGSWIHILITRTAAGVVNIYANGVRSGAADQSSGTPASGTTNLVFGNRTIGDRPIVGKIDNIILTNSIQTNYATKKQMLMSPSTFWTQGNSSTIGSLWPTGTKAVIPITVNHTKVGESANNFLYQYRLLLTNDQSFKNAFSSAANITIHDTATGLQLPSRIIYSNKDTVYIYFDGQTDAVTDKAFFVCAGPTISRTDKTIAFTNSNIANFWGLGESSATQLDYADSKNGTVSGGATTGVPGVFDGAITTINTSKIDFAEILPIKSVSKFTVSQVLKFNEFTSAQYFFVTSPYVADSLIRMRVQSDNMYVTINNSTTSSASFSTSSLSDSTWYHITVAYDGTQATNDTKLRVYVNDVAKALSFTGTVPTTTSSKASVYVGTLAASSIVGAIDEMLLSTDSYSAGRVTTRSNMIMTPTTFWTQGRALVVGRNGMLMNPVKWRLRSGF